MENISCTNNLQETGKIEKCNINTDSIPNSNSRDHPVVIDHNNSKMNYFSAGLQQEVDKKTIVEFTQWLHGEFKDVFMVMGCFNGAFPL